MNTTNAGAVKSTRVWASRTTMLKRAAVVLLLGGIMFITTGCYDDRYYGHRPVRAGYYASYGGPAPYYGHNPYGYDPYGYGGYGYGGYGTGVGIGISSYRGRTGYRDGYYGRRNYGPSGYYRRPWDGRRGDGRRNWDDRGDRRRNWDRRGDDDRDRRSNRRRRARSEGGSEVRRSTAPDPSQGEPVERQPE